MDCDPFYNNKMDKVDAELKKEAEEAGLELLMFSEVIMSGKKTLKTFKPQRPTADNLAFIMYTSGTSGNPKGVLLTHRNGVYSAMCILKSVFLYFYSFLSFI